jgi:predicted RecA/RadA family phage recombinase
VKNLIQPGNTITVTAPAGGVVSGAVVIIGAIVGVAAYNAAAGADVEIATQGVFDLTKTPADVLVQGAVAKVTPATGLVGVAGTAAIGWVVAAAAAGATTARVRLTPAVAGTPTVLEAE